MRILTTKKLIFVLSALLITIIVVWIIRFYTVDNSEEKTSKLKTPPVKKKTPTDITKKESDKVKNEKDEGKENFTKEIFCELSGEVFYIIKPSKKIPIKNGTVSLKSISLNNPLKVYIDEIDGNGNYKISQLPPGEYYSAVQYTDENLSGIYSKFILIPNQSHFRYDIKIPTCKIIGKVRSVKDNNVVPGATVLCFKKKSDELIYPLDWSKNFCNLSVTDENGSFQIANNGTIIIGEYVLYVRKENFGFTFKGISIEDEDGIVEVVISLPGESVIEGRIITSENFKETPISEAFVYAVCKESSFPVWINSSETVADELGYYKISGLSEGSYDLFVFTKKNGQARVDDIYLKQGSHLQRDIFLKSSPVKLKLFVKSFTTHEKLDTFKSEIFYNDGTPVFLIEATYTNELCEETLSPGEYKILIESPGYERYETNLTLKAGEDEKSFEILMRPKKD